MTLTLLYSPMIDFIFSNKTFLKQELVKNGLFREILQTNIHLETAQKLLNDHLADEVSNNSLRT